MIWHFFEVWFLLAISFAVGCLLGGYFYSLLAESRLALVQGAVADQVGDVVDRIKASLGLSPDWRPHVRSVERGGAEPPVATRPSRAAEPVIEAIPLADVEVIEEAEFEEIATLEEAVELPSIEAPATAERPRLQAPPPPLTPSLPREEQAVPDAGEPDRLASVGAVADDGIVPMRPAGLARPRAGVPDNLTRIRGIGERNEVRLNNLGIYHFGQIASWTPAEVRWIGQYLAFPERIERDDWVGQAMILASGGDTGFEKSAERRRRRRREKQVGVDTTQLASDVEAVMGRRRSTPRPEADSDED